MDIEDKAFFMLNLNEDEIQLINVKLPTIVGILAFISIINATYDNLKARKVFIFQLLVFMSSHAHFHAQLSRSFQTELS